jgi:uncharacterized protein YfaS (alpha-2-macroglobulin family)
LIKASPKSFALNKKNRFNQQLKRINTKCMELKKLFFSAVLIFISIAGAYSIYGDQKMKPAPLQTSKPDTYAKDWKTVDDLAKKGLNKSALEVVAQIYKKAKAENNAPQRVKAIIHRMKFEQMMEEYSNMTAINELNEELKTATFPLKPILHSILADVYWSYYQNNRWKFQNRTTVTTTAISDDIATWDLKTIFSKVIQHYEASIQNPEKLKQTPIDIFDDVLLIQKSTRKLRPTLFDFLAHRAIDFYENEEAGLIQPAYKFELNDASYFLPYADFAKLKFTTKDTLSAPFHALQLLQELISFHSDISDKGKIQVLVDVDLERLRFVKNKSILETKDSLYLLDLQDLAKHFADDVAAAEINYEIAQVYADKGNDYQPLVSEENRWMKKKAFDLCEAVIKKYPESDGAKNCAVLKAQISTHDMKLTTDNIISPDKPALGLLSYKNLKKVYLRIIQPKVPETEHGESKLYGEELVNFYLKSPAIKEWTLDLPDENDYQAHASEIKIPELAAGTYVLLLGSTKEFAYKNNGVAYTPLTVSNISYIVRQMPNGSFDCYVEHRETGAPLKNVTAQLYYDKYNYKTQKREYNSSEKYTSDVNGYFIINPTKEYRSIRVDFSYNASTTSKNSSDFLRADNVAYQYQVDSMEKKKVATTFFFLDRGIYRPGQTIYFKGIMINADAESNEILPKTKTKVSLFDVNGQQVSSLDLITNEYGTFNGSFTAPFGGLTGDMRISNENGDTYFSVEEYKRPKFEVRFRPVKGNYRLNEAVEVSGSVKSFSGAALGNAEVKYRVVRNTFYHDQPYYFKGYLPASPQMEITNGTTTTSDTGSFVINFKALPDPSISRKYAPEYSFTIYADVTDINGETHSSQKELRVAYTALKLDIDVPEHVDKSKPADFSVHISNMNGEETPASCKIEIYKLKQPERTYRDRKWTQPDQHLLSKEEFAKDFPLDQYSNENTVSTWPREEKTLDQSLESFRQSLRITNLKNWTPGMYVLEAHSKDAYGEDVKVIKYFTVYSISEKQAPVNVVNWFTEISKSPYEPGDKASFLLGTRENDVHVIYEVERMGVVLKKEFLVLNNEQKLIELPIEERYRGGVAIHYVFIKNNRSYCRSTLLTVPYTNKELEIEFETFRDKLLPGEQEEWKLKIRDKKGEKAVAEMVATLYDASLDQFRPNNWYFDIYRNYYLSFNWDNQHAFELSTSQLVATDWNNYPTGVSKIYEALNWFDYQFHGSERGYHMGGGRNVFYKNRPEMNMPVPASAPGMVKSEAKDADSKSAAPLKEASPSKETAMGTIATRKNFSETAFFYPQLETDKDGNIIIKFTIPEATTKWKMMGLAHTKELKFGMINKQLITQKELMVVPNVPRFFRENDKLQLTTKISNISDQDMSGEAQLFLYDAKTMTEISTSLFVEDKAQKSFILSKGQNTVVGWNIAIPGNVDAITYKVVAKAGNFSDGEEMTIPVLTNRMLVTESMPLYVSGNQTKAFHFEKFANQNNGSTTLRNRNLTLEFTSNPAWYAVQALPYLMEYPYDCSEQIFSKFYANSLATHVANSSPKIRAVFDAWKNAGGEKSTLISNLDKNEELKSLLLEETPWVMEANDETERKKRVSLLFDLNKMSNEFTQAIQQLKKRQSPNGAWPWFAGMPDDRYITQYIVTGMGHLDHLQVKPVHENTEVRAMLEAAIPYLDDRIADDYDWLMKHSKSQMNANQLGALQIQYLYARSYFKDIPLESKNKTAFDYYLKQAEKYWLSNSRYLQGMIALALNRNDKKEAALGIMKSLKENAIISEEMGMYWKESYENYYWYQSAIEAQALLVEAFDEVAADTSSVDALKVWLLRSKQTQNWKTTKATAEAVYALLLKGTDWLSTENAVELKVGSTIITADKDNADTKPEAGTGYFKTSWTGSDIQPSMADISITKKDAGISWGSMYWQYFEQLDKITPAKTPLQLKKSLFLRKNTDAGFVLDPITTASKLKVGDQVIVRIELRADRNMEYVHMKDMRASGLEPVNVLSSYKYRDGLGYYESTRDAATNFFFGNLPKGTYVFEYPLVITHEGDFSNGISSIQCMYAPEFTSHSEGVRIKIGE